MKIFPHILSRVGGLEFKLTEQLAFQQMDIVNVLLEKEKKIEISKEQIINVFQSSFKKTKNYRFRAILLNAQKDFSNNRFSFVKKLEKNAKDDLEKKLVVDLKNQIFNFQSQLMDFEETKSEFQVEFKLDENRQIKFLQKISSGENFQKGILQSSQSIFQRIQKFQSKPIHDLRKKEFQTARSVAQYFYRISAKTSPFSYFTTLDLLSEKDGYFNSLNSTNENSYLQFNNFLLIEIRKQLLQIPSFFLQLKVELNSTIRLKNEEFSFLKNERNIETIQKIEALEVLKLLYNNIITKAIDFEEVVDEFEKVIEAERPDLINYLLEIIETGFLEWQWDESPLDLNWDKPFLIWLKKLNDFEGKEKWISFLEKLILSKNNYQNSNSKKRFLIQKKIKEDLEKMNILDFPNELIFFEDVQISKEISLDKSKIQPIVNSLNTLLKWLEQFGKDEMRNKILFFWENNFKKTDQIPLLDFYEKFYQIDFSKYNFDANEKEINRTFLKRIIRKEGEIFNISTDELVPLFPHTISKSYAAIFQFYKNSEKTKAIINGIAPGYGKLFGRFLPLFDDTIKEKLRLENEDFEKERFCIENTDASIFNANQHPSFFNFEIKTPNGQNQLSIDNQIFLKDLRVIWDKDLMEPTLVSTKETKPVSIYDFGFEHPSNRSPLYRLLNGFQNHHTTFRILTKKINELFSEKKENGIQFFPRIVIDGHLVLQRKYLELPISFFPKKEKTDSNDSYFYKIQRWKNNKNIQRHIFIQPIRNQGTDSDLKKDFFKPQYFDLESPFAIVLLQRILNKHTGRIKVEEMLPEQKNKFGKYVREEVVQWNAIK